ncbi:SHOCT domain-containing protein [Bradyrhizobium sp. STM 3562]|uniref:SHOCT domain-containing protein n=1 Tax=Bradyrhizobium sp. STM 3562 TaxID=578924 RepID=UPI003890E121
MSSKEGVMLFEGGFTFSNFLIDVLTIFAFVVWFWFVITIFADLFRRHDISGWAKAIWVIVLILTSYLGVIVYLITQGRGMAERNAQQAQAARDELRRVVGFSVADELGKLDQLRKAGSITEGEFTRLRAKLVQ